MIASSLHLCFLEMTSVGITKISPENPFGRKAGEGSAEAEAQEICVKIITHMWILVMQIQFSLTSYGL